MDIKTAEATVRLIEEKKIAEKRIETLKKEGVGGIMTDGGTGIFLKDEDLRHNIYSSVLAYLNRERDLIVAEIKEL